MDRATRQYLNDAPWPSDSDFAAMAGKRRPRLWPLAIIYLTGAVAGTIATIIEPVATAGLGWMAAGMAWSLVWLGLMARVLRRQKAWDQKHTGKGYDYSRWG